MSDTRQEIRERMTGDIDPSYDTTERSFFYENLDSVAIELEPKYEEMVDNERNKFMSTADDLQQAILIAKDFGVDWKDATYASGPVEIEGTVGQALNADDLVASERAEYRILQTTAIPSGGKVTVNVECTVRGAIGNAAVGSIRFFPVTLPGITSVTNKQAFVNGFEAETVEELKKRQQDKVRTSVTSGNDAYYKVLAEGVTGVGVAKVFSLENGPGTATITIIDANGLPASTELINNVKSVVELNRIIGLNPTIDTATAKTINIAGQVTVESGSSLPNIKTAVEDALIGEFEKIAFVESVVKYSDLFTLVRETDGVSDLQNFTVNGATTNITLQAKEVPVKGTVNLT